MNRASGDLNLAKKIEAVADKLAEDVNTLTEQLRYNHFCKISKTNSFEIHLQFMDTKSTAFTLSELMSKGITNIPVTGFYYNDSVYISVMTIEFIETVLKLWGFKSSSPNYDIKYKTFDTAVDTDIVFSDTVL